MVFVYKKTPCLVLLHGPVGYVHLGLAGNIVLYGTEFTGRLEGMLECCEIPVDLVALTGGENGGHGIVLGIVLFLVFFLVFLCSNVSVDIINSNLKFF